jgi:hypothetical protein
MRSLSDQHTALTSLQSAPDPHNNHKRSDEVSTQSASDGLNDTSEDMLRVPIIQPDGEDRPGYG